MDIKFDFGRYDKVSGIYFIECVKNKKMYVGSTNNFIIRLECHRSELRGGYHGNDFLQRAWKKYGEESFIIGILERVENIDDLLNREQYYIDKIKPEFNLCSEVRRHNFSEYSKKKLSDSRKLLFSTGKLKPSVETAVIQYSLSGEYINEYKSITEAYRQTGICDDLIFKCTSFKAKQAKGFIWRKKSCTKPVLPTRKSKEFHIKVIDTFTKEEMIFYTQTDCAKFFNIKQCNISAKISNYNNTLYRKRYKLIALYKSDKLLGNQEIDNQQPITPLTKCAGSTTNS